MADLLKTSELAARLGVSHQQVSAWVRLGIPRLADGRFDLADVQRWLQQAGKAPTPEDQANGQTILKTRADVARHFGVSQRTVAYWLGEADFPGRSGNPRQGVDGCFPVDEITSWLDSRGLRSGTGTGNLSVARDRAMAARAEREELDLGRERMELIDAEAIQRFFVRVVRGTTSILDAMPATLAGNLPRSLTLTINGKRRTVPFPPEIINALIDVAQETADDVAAVVRELVEGDADDSEVGKE